MPKVYLNNMKIVVILSLFILSSCGVQGDLYLPDDSSKTDAEQTSN